MYISLIINNHPFLNTFRRSNTEVWFRQCGSGKVTGRSQEYLFGKTLKMKNA